MYFLFFFQNALQCRVVAGKDEAHYTRMNKAFILKKGTAPKHTQLHVLCKRRARSFTDGSMRCKCKDNTRPVHKSSISLKENVLSTDGVLQARHSILKHWCHEIAKGNVMHSSRWLVSSFVSFFLSKMFEFLAYHCLIAVLIVCLFIIDMRKILCLIEMQL